jgi:iron complex outermembrane recepter protein
MNIKSCLLMTSALVAACSMPNMAMAQDQTNAESAEDNAGITVIGSRRAEARSNVDSAVPVDVLKSEDLRSQGSSDIIDSLSAVVPSLSSAREPISDAATLVRPVNLRALPSDHTLVLVNGKRRHRGAVVGEFVSGVNRGAQGVDINPLFPAGLKQVEVLRDGAAAQYGSDAIAGVINYQLLDDPTVRSLSVQYTQAYEGDGETLEANAALGARLGSDGFVTLAFQWKDQKATSRGVQDGQSLSGPNQGAAALADAGFPVANPVVVWGQPNVKDDYKFLLNSSIPLGGAELYAFGGYATRNVDGSFFYRNPSRRPGIFTNDDGNVLFANTTGVGTCPTGPLPRTSFADAQAFINAAPANCFAFFSRFPGGFTPRFGGVVKDTSINGGIKGEIGESFKYDFSAGYGRNALDYKLNNTLNPSLGPLSPTSFDLGAQIQAEYIVNADFSYPLEIGFASPLNIAFGAQYLRDSFEIKQGEPDSYRDGPFTSQGFLVGSNGFQGFNDRVAGKSKRRSIGTYLDLEADVTDAFLLSGAVRYENYSDFGDTFNGKIAGRYKFGDNFSIRASSSTGFRAPTLGQSNLERSATSFTDGQLIQTLVIASTNPIAEFFGGGQLDPEKARNFSIGATAQFGRISLTADYFNIKVKDRVALTTKSISDTDRTALLAAGNPDAASIKEVQFFINDFNSKTQGVDVVLNVPFNWSAGNTDLTWAFSYNDTKVTNRGDTITDGRLAEIEGALPATRLTFSASHKTGNFNALARVNYYGKSFENLFNDETLPISTPSLAIIDLEVGYTFAEKFKLSVGAKNLLDTYPEEWTLGGDTGRSGGFLGAIYPLNHPAGFNGGSYYVRLSADF